MIRYTRWGAGVLCALLALAVVVLAPHMTSAQPLTQAVGPIQGISGTQFNFQGNGFQPGEKIGFWLNSPSGVSIGSNSYITVADGNGQASWSWIAPNPAVTGYWSLVAVGIISKQAHIIPFQIQSTPDAPGTTMPEAAIQPTSGVPGTVLAFYGQNFKNHDRVTYWFNTPSQAIYSGNTIGTNGAGRADSSWTIPVNAQAGTWTIVIYGREAGLTYVVPFTVT